MWDAIEARIDENDREAVQPLRQAFLSVLRGSGVRPGTTATKKVVALEFGADERLIWQIEGTARNFYLHHKWQEQLEAAGLTVELFVFESDKKDGGRHSGLSRDWSFGGSDCIQIKIDSEELLDTTIKTVGVGGIR